MNIHTYHITFNDGSSIDEQGYSKFDVEYMCTKMWPYKTITSIEVTV